MSNVALSHLCLIESTDSGKKEIVCGATLEKISALVVALIGVAFLSSGLYLLLGGIGTIPAFTCGIGLLVGGVAVLSALSFCQTRIK